MFIFARKNINISVIGAIYILVKHAGNELTITLKAERTTIMILTVIDVQYISDYTFSVHSATE